MAIHPSISFGQKKNSKVFIYILVASLVLLSVAAYWNWFAPKQNYWPLIVGDLLTVLPAFGAALAGTLLLRQFEPGEKPRVVWFWFVTGWWVWLVGEICSMGYDVFRVPYGFLSIYDIFWTLGYLCFGLSLFYQYRNIYSSPKKSGMVYFLAVVALILVATLGLTQWALTAGLGEGMSRFALYLAVFYPACDLAVGLTALWLAFLFGRGAWGRPWWGLIVFAVADGINIFLWIGGKTVIPENIANFLSPLSNTIYNAGYLVVMLGFLFILFLNVWSALPKAEEPAVPMS